MNRIEVYLPVDLGETGVITEWLYARRISKNFVKIENIPFFIDEFGLGALVRVKGRRIVGVVKKGDRSRYAQFTPHGSEQENIERWKEIRTYLAQFDITCEWAPPGWVGMAIPRNISDERLKAICAECSVPFELYDDEDDIDPR
jgi:hypothetical protein